MRQILPRLFAIAALSLPAVMPAPRACAAPPDRALRSAISDPQRSPDFVRRDAARHPLRELEFFGLRPDQRVVEIWPAGGYWTEILAPVLHARGTYYLALPPSKPGADADNTPILRELAANPGIYGKVIVTRAGSGHFDVARPAPPT